ncbi:unnamed protein product, partial [Rotaria sp. Silwood1]
MQRMENAAGSPLVVIVSGGGPVGLTFSLNLVMMMGNWVKIIIYEGRWFVDEFGITRWQGEEHGKFRRNQVVILQDHTILQLPEYVQNGLFKQINERVWPSSRNIPIREVEDQLLNLIQPFVRSGQVELICEQLDEQSKHLVEGADGSNSFVRRYCNIQMISEGMEYACGIAYEIPLNVPPSNEPLHQAVNCILSASQTRYMVSSSSSLRQGYLYIRLIQDEYNILRKYLQEAQSRNKRLDLSDHEICPKSPIWSIVRQGLKFFNICEKFVSRIIPIEINVRHASIVIRELRSESDPARTMLSFIVGDAAMNVHFWPGRGMNSGMKAAMALARNIFRSFNSRTLSNEMMDRSLLPFLHFLDFEGFMARLRAREQQGRSLRILINPIDSTVQQAHTNAHLDYCYEEYKNKLREKIIHTRQQFQGLPDWSYPTRPVTNTELEDAINRIDFNAVAQLSLANAWPTREMNGVEVLVEDIFPFSQQQYLLLPKAHSKNFLHRTPSIAPRHRHLILWIDGDEVNENTKRLIAAIRSSPEFADTSSMTAQASVQFYSSSTNALQKLNVVPTFASALNWIRKNRETIEEQDTRFKVIFAWPLTSDQTVVDVIRGIRCEARHVPILVYTSKSEQTQGALEFPDIIITDMIGQ